MASIKFKRGTENRWRQLNLILENGEPGFEYDTGRLKIGDGIHRWLELDYIGGSGGKTEVEFVAKYDDLPKVGTANILYAVASDKLIYLWNASSSKYESFGSSGSFDPSIISNINGGTANG